VKRLFFIFILLSLFLFNFAFSYSEDQPKKSKPYKEGEVLVKFKSDYTRYLQSLSLESRKKEV